MIEVTTEDIRYGPYNIRIWYVGGRPDAWTRVPTVFSPVPDWLSDAMDAYIEHGGYADMDIRAYLVTMFGDQA